MEVEIAAFKQGTPTTPGDLTVKLASDSDDLESMSEFKGWAEDLQQVGGLQTRKGGKVL